ncbi:hypothetical protein Taro_019255, partial [Colocasia esculenta]|nr:hypothetical protein [Colocasia esculenta]
MTVTTTRQERLRRYAYHYKRGDTRHSQVHKSSTLDRHLARPTTDLSIGSVRPSSRLGGLAGQELGASVTRRQPSFHLVTLAEADFASDSQLLDSHRRIQESTDLPIIRRVSLHRFLEKRKDRISSRAPYQLNASTVDWGMEVGGGGKGSRGVGGVWGRGGYLLPPEKIPRCRIRPHAAGEGNVSLQPAHGVQFHSYAREVASPDLSLCRVHEMPKNNILLDIKYKLEKALGLPHKERPPVNATDTDAASQYAKDMITIRGRRISTFSETSVCHKDCKVSRRELQKKMQEYAMLGDLSGAMEFLDLMRPLTIVDCNALLYSYTKSGHASVEHLKMLYDMLVTCGLHPNVWTFNIISNGLCNLGHMKDAFWFIEEMCLQGYIPSFPSLSRLMKKSLRLDALDISLSLLDLMLKYSYRPTESVFSFLISRLSRIGRISEAYSIFSLLLDLDLCPKVHSYNPILFALCKSGEILVALSIFCFVGKKGFVQNVYSYTALVLGFCEKRLWTDAYRTLIQMQGSGCEPNAVTYSILIKSLCDDGKVSKALDLLVMMTKQGCNADLLVYNVIIRAFCVRGMIFEVCELMQAASEKGLSPDAFSLSALAGGILKAGKVSHALACLSSTSGRGLMREVVTWNIYFHCLCCDGKSREALFLLTKKMEEDFAPSVVTYNTILKGYCKEQKIDQALQLFDHFEWPKGGPDLISFNTILSEACKQRRTLIIKRILHYMDHMGVKLDLISIFCLLRYFCKTTQREDILTGGLGLKMMPLIFLCLLFKVFYRTPIQIVMELDTICQAVCMSLLLHYALVLVKAKVPILLVLQE